MIDLNAIQAAVDTTLKAELEKARSGRAGYVRGSRSRFLLQEEIAGVARTAVKEAYNFNIADLPAYVADHPDFLSMEREKGPVGVTLAEALIVHLAKNAAEKSQRTVLATNMPVSPHDVLADLEDTLKLAADLGPHNTSHSLARANDRCMEEPSVETYRSVAMEAAVLSDSSRKLAYKLDIGDPSRAILAGQIYRRLLEAADQIEFMLEIEPDDTFTREPAALTP
ncbi:hypothetical protein [Rhizobium sp. MHM7A]|uniref:hypothetical protein n=1 Tax=Rhizobium sp. MHM7A TaxID=2583233 RepID=UPI001106E687|nr:hypothetical protein [Rhizobium sp. MHM7A]TLX15991.1 hypothetical protein FFR93_01350 [Rhizobium sp. MHM7A]